jgi:hypothetical protein
MASSREDGAIARRMAVPHTQRSEHVTQVILPVNAKGKSRISRRRRLASYFRRIVATQPQ